VLEKMALREACVGKVGTMRCWCWKKWHKERLLLEKLALRESCVGKVGTKIGLCWKSWH